jgi:hypothetical protein
MGEPEFQKVQGDWAPAALTLVVVDGHVLLRICTLIGVLASLNPTLMGGSKFND